MKLRVPVTETVTYDITAVRCVLPVRYGEEDISNDFPHRKGDVWDITIDADTGRIRDWPKGRCADIHMKVCDGGSYYLLCGNKVIAKKEEDYVPGCIPGSYGDYVEFTIDADGTIKQWCEKFTSERVKESFFEPHSSRP